MTRLTAAILAKKIFFFAVALLHEYWELDKNLVYRRSTARDLHAEHVFRFQKYIYRVPIQGRELRNFFRNGHFSGHAKSPYDLVTEKQ